MASAALLALLLIAQAKADPRIAASAIDPRLEFHDPTWIHKHESVCVTGAGGYVATELIKQLLEDGFRVMATVRDMKVREKFKHLLDLDRALPGSLAIVEADLLKEGSFDICAAKAKYLFHTASPFHFNAKNSSKEMIRPAVEGTENVMRSAIKHKIKRVIVTSSFAASSSFLPEDKPDSGSLYTEEDWNDFIDQEIWEKNSQQAYIASKSLAERKAWELGKKHSVDVVVIQPALVMGPVIAPRLEGTSFNLMKHIIEGKKVAYLKRQVLGGAKSFSFPWCDNRDVARAHIKAALNPAASGRYIVAHPSTIPYSYLYGVLSKAFPQVAFAKPEEEESQQAIINNTKIMSLLSHLYPVEQTMTDMARSLMSAKLVNVAQHPKTKKVSARTEL